MKSVIRQNIGTKICTKAALIFASLFFIGLTHSAHAVEGETVCGPEVKEEVAKLVSAMAGMSPKRKEKLESKLYEKYKYCAQDAGLTSQQAAKNLHAAARQCGAKVSHLGSVFYEEMSCCGYDPQRRQFACPVKIKQTFGFGGAPLPGSREYVLHCVADASGTLVPVGRDSVHLANELQGNNPSWQFSVIANANNHLGTVQPMSGETRRARSILSWGLEPTSCNYQPIWGNALNYRIRLDQ